MTRLNICELPECEVTFTPRHGGTPQKYCSHAHMRLAKNRRDYASNSEKYLARKRKPKFIKVCELPECNVEFETSKVNGPNAKKFCSRKHSNLAAKRSEIARRGDEVNSIRRDRYAANPEPYQESAYKWRDNNPERAKELRHLYYLTDVGYAKTRASSSSYGASKRGAIVDPEFKDAILADILLNTLVCANCPKELDIHDRLIDHKIPICFGGQHTASNIQILCAECHWAKSGAEAAEFSALARQLVRAHVAA
jgi:5-methylcytosine-specific restriction endonuclease McrA